MPRRRAYATKWDQCDDLGMVPDGVIADRIGVTTHAVRQARSRRRIPAYMPPRVHVHRLQCMASADMLDALVEVQMDYDMGSVSEAVRKAIVTGLKYL